MSHLEWYGERRCSPSGTGRGRTFGKRDAHPALRKRQLTINGQVLRLANPTTGRLVACTGQAEGEEDRGLKRGEKRVVIVQKPTKLRLGFRFWPAPGNETKEHSRSKYGNFSLAPNRQLASSRVSRLPGASSCFCWQFLQWLAGV